MFGENHKNGSAKMAFFASDKLFNAYKRRHPESARPFEDSLVTSHIGFVFLPNNFMLDFTDELVTRLLPSGIIQHSNKFHEWCHFPDYVIEEESEPQVLTLDDLSFGFVMWICACCITFVVFPMEIFYRHFWFIYVIHGVWPTLRHFLSIWGFLNVLRIKLARV